MSSRCMHVHAKENHAEHLNSIFSAILRGHSFAVSFKF